MAESAVRRDNAAKARRLRRKHPQFTYEGFVLERLPDALKVRFCYAMAPDLVFAPETVVEGIRDADIDGIGGAALENLIFHIGLIESLSYWKAACSPLIVIRAGILDESQISWFRELLFSGMGEYFYVNGIDFRQSDFVDIAVEGSRAHERSFLDVAPLRRERSLLLLSGGKDSSLAAEILKEAGDDYRCLLLNPTEAAWAVGRAAGCLSPVIIRRTIDRKLLDLNAAGYLNGHTPFSALLAFWGWACAVLFRCRNVIVANERSAEEGNVEFLGRMINHQYSKSFAFEAAFQRYAAHYLSTGISYFSLLRPLYDLQISRIFARYPQYFPVFRSCNRNQADNSWCGKCAKCISTFIGLFPFLDTADMAGIFGRNLYNDPAIMPVVRDLAGMGDHKPFECVGTADETAAGLYLAALKLEEAHQPLPTVLRRVSAEILPFFADLPALAARLLSAWSGDHQLPPRYVALLKERLGLPS